MNAGKIVAIAGPVVEGEFRDCALPKIREALTVEVRGHTYVMEVAQQIGDGTVRCIMLAQSEYLARGMKVVATGFGIRVPVGEKTLGRMFNALGEPIDGGEPFPEDAQRWEIHRKAPAFSEQRPTVDILETGTVPEYHVMDGGIITVNTETAAALDLDYSAFNDLAGTVVEVETTAE